MTRVLWAVLPFFVFLGLARAASDPRDSDSPFGILDFLVWDHNWNGFHYGGDKVERAAALMKEAGVGFVRLDFLWDDVESEKGRWDFAKYDRIVETLARHDIKILGLLHYNATWTGAQWKDAPDPELFTLYVRAVVGRYKTQVKYWEVWNEPNEAIYWVPQDGLKAYTRLLQKVYPAIKGTDPTARVLVGGLSANIPVSLRQLYQNGGKDAFDILAIHPFAGPFVPHGLKRVRGITDDVREIMEKNGDGAKPIWFTELGCPGVPAGKETKDWWLGRNPSEEEQARWVEEVLTEPLKWKGVEKVFWAFFRDTPDHFLSGVDFFGLLREDFSKKPSFEAYRKKARAA